MIIRDLVLWKFDVALQNSNPTALLLNTTSKGMPVPLFMLLNSNEMVLESNLLNFNDLVQSLAAQAQSLLLLFSSKWSLPRLLLFSSLSFSLLFSVQRAKKQASSFAISMYVLVCFLRQLSTYLMWNVKRKDYCVLTYLFSTIRLHILGDHPYITPAKGLGGWGQKNGNFCWLSVLFMLT